MFLLAREHLVIAVITLVKVISAFLREDISQLCQNMQVS